MKRVFGKIEVVFDGLYLLTATGIGFYLIQSSVDHPERFLAGIMAFVLVGGDAFHLIPRIIVTLSDDEEKYRRALGRGKQITSITMTFFYLILWHIGSSLYRLKIDFGWTLVIYSLALIRIFLCFLPQNNWTQRYPPVEWGILRNIPFFLMGLMVSGLFFIFQFNQPGFQWAWLAILLSFLFYIPVVLWANENPKIGMLMLPKTISYVWLLIMCLSL